MSGKDQKTTAATAGWDPNHMNVVYPCAGRPVSAPLEELFQVRIFSFGLEFHRSIRKVSHKSLNPQPHGLITSRCPIKNSLNPPGYDRLKPLYHGVPGHSVCFTRGKLPPELPLRTVILLRVYHRCPLFDNRKFGFHIARLKFCAGTDRMGYMITITEKAVQKVKAFAAADPTANGKALRIFVQGGGCSGFQYGFAFDEQKDGDTLIDQGEVKVVVDSYSSPYLQESTVDYVEDFRGSGFVVQNPNAKGSCGCGSSFTV